MVRGIEQDICSRLWSGRKHDGDNGIQSYGPGDKAASDPMLLVGVRTAVVSNFPFRQAIRETWASKSVLPQGVKVVFWDVDRTRRELAEILTTLEFGSLWSWRSRFTATY